MLYNDACIYYEEKNYMKSINRCENGIKDDYMIDDITAKLESKLNGMFDGMATSFTM